jgi:hypothetical protein
VYTIYSILSLVFVILIIVTAFITIALTYFQLAVEDHGWWWRSFLCGGSTGAPSAGVGCCSAAGPKHCTDDDAKCALGWGVSCAHVPHVLRLPVLMWRAGIFIYFYCFYYYLARSDMSGFMQTSFFFGALGSHRDYRLHPWLPRLQFQHVFDFCGTESAKHRDGGYVCRRLHGVHMLWFLHHARHCRLESIAHVRPSYLQGDDHSRGHAGFGIPSRASHCSC